MLRSFAGDLAIHDAEGLRTDGALLRLPRQSHRYDHERHARRQILCIGAASVHEAAREACAVRRMLLMLEVEGRVYQAALRSGAWTVPVADMMARVAFVSYDRNTCTAS